jgi:predicted ester cyclase
MSASATLLSEQQLITAAKAPTVAYNEKNWDAVKASITTGFEYDEVATQRKAQGADAVLTLWKGWATAFPDSKASFDHVYAIGDQVVLELTWRGTHQGPLTTPKGTIAPTGKRIEFRSCVICELAGDKAKLQRQYFDMGTMLQQIGATG